MATERLEHHATKRQAKLCTSVTVNRFTPACRGRDVSATELLERGAYLLTTPILLRRLGELSLWTTMRRTLLPPTGGKERPFRGELVASDLTRRRT